MNLLGLLRQVPGHLKRALTAAWATFLRVFRDPWNRS